MRAPGRVVSRSRGVAGCGWPREALEFATLEFSSLTSARHSRVKPGERTLCQESIATTASPNRLGKRVQSPAWCDTGKPQSKQSRLPPVPGPGLICPGEQRSWRDHWPSVSPSPGTLWGSLSRKLRACGGGDLQWGRLHRALREPFKVTAGGRWEETQCGGKAARSLVLASLLEKKAGGKTSRAMQALIPSDWGKNRKWLVLASVRVDGNGECRRSSKDREGWEVEDREGSVGTQSPGQGPRGHCCKGLHGARPSTVEVPG